MSPARVLQVAWMAALLVLGLSSLASAADPHAVVTVDVRPEGDDIPTHVCVVSHAEGPRARTEVDQLVVPGSGPDWKVKLDGAGLKSEADACSSSGACEPRVSLGGDLQPEGLHAACTADGLASPEDLARPRLLVLMLEHLEASPPVIESVKLAGGVVTVGVRARLAGVVVTARSLGGHYVPDRRAVRAEGGAHKLVVLPVTPRCRSVIADLPGVRLREADRASLEAWAHAEPLPSACIGDLRGDSRVPVELPVGGADGRLELALEGGERGRWATRWEGRWPEADRLELAHEVLAFSWEAPACVYDSQSCPRATLEGGVACTATREGNACNYRCPGAADEREVLALRTPVAVDFEARSPSERPLRWTEILQRPGQRLTGFLDDHRVHLRADVSKWRTDVPGSRITHVEILGPDGNARTYGLEGVSELDVLAPGVGCEPVRYRLVGDRRYKEGTAKVVDGELSFGKVERTARVLSFDLAVLQGGGPSLISDDAPSDVANPSYFVGLVQVAAILRPRNPKAARMSFEIRLGGTLGQWGSFDQESIGDTPREVTRKVGWTRFLAEPAIGVDIVGPLSMSAGVGVGTAWPFSAGDLERVGRSDFVVSPNLGARLRVRRWLEFEVQGRAFLNERTGVETSDNGTLRRDFYPTTSLVGLYGARFKF